LRLLLELPTGPELTQQSMNREIYPIKLDKIIDMSSRMYLEAIPKGNNLNPSTLGDRAMGLLKDLFQSFPMRIGENMMRIGTSDEWGIERTNV